MRTVFFFFDVQEGKKKPMAERLREWYDKCTELQIPSKIKRFLNNKWEFANGDDTHNAEAFVQKYSKEGWTPYMDGEETVAENAQQMQVVFEIETAADTVSCQLRNKQGYYTLDTRPVNIGGNKFKLRYRVYRAQPELEHKLVPVEDIKPFQDIGYNDALGLASDDALDDALYGEADSDGWVLPKQDGADEL